MRRVVGLTEAQANERLQLPPAPSRTTSPRFANASRRPASSSPVTRMAGASRCARGVAAQVQKPAVSGNARSRGSLHPRRRARLLRPLDNRARPLTALQRALLRRARARRPARLERRQRDRARRVDHAARGARARRARRNPAGGCNADRAQGPVALQRSARRVRIRAQPCPRWKRTAPAGRRARRARRSSAAAIRSTSRSTGAIRRKPAQTSYDITAGEPKRLDARVMRLTAPNPGVMTGPGNQYLLPRVAR